ncbi:hypothetical protein LTR95_015375 [Oleoguttula sp. CCFEE 5521]
MSGRGYAFAGTIIASAFAIMTVYTSLGPELARDAAERYGQPVQQRTTGESESESDDKDTVISRAIASDFKQAAEELKAPGKAGGFAWKIRERIWGSGKSEEAGVVVDQGRRDAVREMEVGRETGK